MPDFLQIIRVFCSPDFRGNLKEPQRVAVKTPNDFSSAPQDKVLWEFSSEFASCNKRKFACAPQQKKVSVPLNGWNFVKFFKLLKFGKFK